MAASAEIARNTRAAPTRRPTRGISRGWAGAGGLPIKRRFPSVRNLNHFPNEFVNDRNVPHIIDKKDREQAKLSAQVHQLFVLCRFRLDPSLSLPLPADYFSNPDLVKSQFRMAARLVYLAHLCQTLDRGSCSLPCDFSSGCPDSASILSPHRSQRLYSVPFAIFWDGRLYPPCRTLARTLAFVLVAPRYRYGPLVRLPVRVDLLRTLAACRRSGPVRRRHHSFPAHRTADGCSGASSSCSAG